MGVCKAKRWESYWTIVKIKTAPSLLVLIHIYNSLVDSKVYYNTSVNTLPSLCYYITESNSKPTRLKISEKLCIDRLTLTVLTINMYILLKVEPIQCHGVRIIQSLLVLY